MAGLRDPANATTVGVTRPLGQNTQGCTGIIGKVMPRNMLSMSSGFVATAM